MNRNCPESVRWRVLVSVDMPCGQSLETPCRSPPSVPVCLHLCICVLHIDILVFLVAVWWRVQCTAGGPSRVSKEGRKNQRVGGEDPSPGVPGKSIFTLQNNVAFPRDLYSVSFPKKQENKDRWSSVVQNFSVFKMKCANKCVCPKIVAQKSNGATKRKFCFYPDTFPPHLQMQSYCKWELSPMQEHLI